MKKLLSAVLVLVMVFAIIPLGAVTASAEALSGTTGDCTWTLVDGVLTISGNGAMEDYGILAFGKIGSSAPWNKEGWDTVKTIKIQEGVTHIGACAFYDFHKLETIFLPKSIQKIGGCAFNGKQNWEEGYYYMDDLKNVYYSGSINDRLKIDITTENDALLNATWHYAVDEPQTATLVENNDGKWYYCPNGERSAETTLVNHKDKWFYVKNGVWNTNYTGLFGYEGKLFYIENGVWDKTANMLFAYKGKGFYIKNGKWAKETTLVKHNGGYSYVKDGIWTKATTLVKYKGKWFGVVDGKWNSSINTLVPYKCDWFYIKNGKWDSSAETLTKYNGKWFYIKSGKWDKTATKFFKYNGKTFYIKNGKWDSSITSLIAYKDKMRYVKNGKWNKSKAIVRYKPKYVEIIDGVYIASSELKGYKGERYYVNNGYVQSNFSGRVKVDGKTYKIKNGKVV